MKVALLYAPTLVLLAWAAAVDLLGRSDGLTVVGLLALSLSLWCHVRQERGRRAR